MKSLFFIFHNQFVVWQYKGVFHVITHDELQSNVYYTCRYMSYMRWEGDRSRAGLPSDGQFVSYELFYLLFLWQSAKGQSLLQCPRSCLLRGRLSSKLSNFSVKPTLHLQVAAWKRLTALLVGVDAALTVQLCRMFVFYS